MMEFSTQSWGGKGRSIVDNVVPQKEQGGRDAAWVFAIRAHHTEWGSASGIRYAGVERLILTAWPVVLY